MFSRSKAAKDGCYYQCKVCAKASYKAYYEANKKKKLDYQKAYNEANKERVAKYHKAYREANKEKRAEYFKVYYEANKEGIKAYREANKERIAESKKAYREANKERAAEYSSQRRARKHNAIPKFLRNCEVERQRLRDIYKLRELLSVATGVEYHVDHMWPLSDNGPHWSGNLQIITAQENLSKNAKVCKVTKKNIRDSLRIAKKEYEDIAAAAKGSK